MVRANSRDPRLVGEECARSGDRGAPFAVRAFGDIGVSPVLKGGIFSFVGIGGFFPNRLLLFVATAPDLPFFRASSSALACSWRTVGLLGGDLGSGMSASFAVYPVVRY